MSKTARNVVIEMRKLGLILMKFGPAFGYSALLV